MGWKDDIMVKQCLWEGGEDDGQAALGERAHAGGIRPGAGRPHLPGPRRGGAHAGRRGAGLYLLLWQGRQHQGRKPRQNRSARSSRAGDLRRLFRL